MGLPATKRTNLHEKYDYPDINGNFFGDCGSACDSWD